MSRPLRYILTTAVILAVFAGLGYAAHAMNLIGLLLAMHSPPPH